MGNTYLSLGSNLGNREENLKTALALLEERAGHVRRCSSFYYSKPWGFCSDNDFVNCCVLVETSLQPLRLLEVTQQIERDMGRTAKTSTADPSAPRYSDRVIDIDILLYDDLSLNLPELQIPHPLMGQRDFVMVPLREILTEKNESDGVEK